MTAVDRWLLHVKRWSECQECSLCTQRDHIVLARGVVPCDVLMIGEAPGISEDTSGLPFDGPAGQKLDEIVAAVRQCTQVSFTDAYTNLVACFPAEAKQTSNHQPEPEEIETCSPRLKEFVDIASPKLIVCVGTLSETWAQQLIGDVGAAWCKVTHPSAVLRMPLVQQGMAIRKCIMTLRDAIESTLIPF